MKTHFLKIFIATVIISFTACEDKDYLDTTPVTRLDPSTAFSTPSLVLASMNGMYNAAQIGEYAGAGRGYIWGAAYIQQNDCRGEDVVNTQAFYQFTYDSTYNDITANNLYYWQDGFRLINRCNVVIEGVKGAVDKGVITAAIGNGYIGEARFLRAITHFELLNHFARNYNFTPGATHPGLPYREVGIDTPQEVESEAAKGRNTVAECYTKILDDLTFAELNIISVTATLKTKASKNAAIAFKTRVNLAKRDWASVVTEYNKIATAFTLTVKPKDAFSLTDAIAGNTEAIFYIGHGSTSVQNPGVNGALASQYNRRELIVISPIIWRDPVWLNDDKRRLLSDMTRSSAASGILTNKYVDGVNYTDATPVIRFAEVLLNVAEAQARLGNTAPALTLLNRVRDRSLNTPLTQTYLSTTFSNATALVGAILKERRIEFITEGKRWGDIHRLQNDDLFPINGIPAKLVSGPVALSLYTLGTPYTGTLGNPAIPSSDRRILWPIPQAETNINPVLKAEQNPGW